MAFFVLDKCVKILFGMDIVTFVKNIHSTSLIILLT